jgi:LPXTG-motif cell wall-anchored protein
LVAAPAATGILGISPLLLGLAALAAGLGLFFAVRNNNDNGTSNSPA